jgi:SAM-dependent methyltransferase
MRDILAGLRVFDIDLRRLRSRNFHADMIRDRDEWLSRLRHCLKPAADFRCPLCGGAGARPYVAYRDYPLFECLDCSAVAPSIDLARLAEANYHSSETVEEDVRREILATFEYRKNTFGPERLAYLREIVPGFHGSSDYLLDVGCGPGYFLSHLKERGIRARGLEVNPSCIRFCREQGLDVDANDLSQEPDGRYSLITMFDVLEHLAEPVEVLRTVHRKLRPGGHLLAYTPNLHSLSTLFMGGQHNMIAVFNHLCFYDARSLDYLARRTGFEVARCDFFGLDVMDYLAMKESEDGHPYYESLRQMVAPLQAVVDAQKLSNSMRVLFRRS